MSAQRTPDEYLREQIRQTRGRLAFERAMLAELRRLQRKPFATIKAARRAIAEAIVRVM